MRAIVTGIAGLVVGGAMVWFFVRRAPGSDSRNQVGSLAEPESGHDDRAPVKPALEAIALRAALRDEVRAAIRDEAAATATVTATATAKLPTPDPTSAAPAQAQEKTPQPPTPSFEEAHTYVAERIAAGVWSEPDRDRLRSAMGRINDEERTQIVRQIIVATNKGQVRVELQGPMF